MDDKLLVFLHIPKTGGTTLSDIFRKSTSYAPGEIVDHLTQEAIHNQYGELSEQERNAVKVILGHHFYGIHEIFAKPPAYFTMLREPVDRVISQYYFLKNYPGFYQEALKDMSFEEYIDWDPQAQNGQTKLISGTNEVTGIEKALEHLNQFELVGVTEMFNESLFFLNRKFGWNVEQYQKVNITKARPAVHEVPDTILKKIEQANPLDIELYKIAKMNLEKQVLALSDKERAELMKIKGDF